MDRQKERERRELQKWQKTLEKPEPKHYFAILIVILSIVYIIDEVTSFMPQSMQSSIIFDLFHITSRDVNSPEYAVAMNKYAVISACSIVFTLIAPFYKSLADKFGRRLFLAINTVGMALGLFVIMTARHPVMYGLGYAITLFVIPNDVQVMYIMEVAPKKHRAKLCSIIKALALISVSSIGIMRSAFMTEELSSWRNVFIIPVVLGTIIGLLSVFFVRETPVFLDERMAYLRSTEEERQEKERQKKNEKSGIVNAMKFLFRHKQHRSIALCVLVFGLSVCATNYYETIMASTMPVEEISRAIIFFPIANSIVTFFSGFLADKTGRKKAALFLGTLAMLGLASFILSAKFRWGAAVTGVSYGVFIGGLWSANDIMTIIMPQESTPTEIRASVTAATYLFSYAGMFLSTVLVIVFQNFVDMGYFCLCMGVLFMFLGLVLMLRKVKETKGADLAAVTGSEFD